MRWTRLAWITIGGVLAVGIWVTASRVWHRPPSTGAEVTSPAAAGNVALHERTSQAPSKEPSLSFGGGLPVYPSGKLLSQGPPEKWVVERCQVEGVKTWYKEALAKDGWRLLADQTEVTDQVETLSFLRDKTFVRYSFRKVDDSVEVGVSTGGED